MVAGLEAGRQPQFHENDALSSRPENLVRPCLLLLFLHKWVVAWWGVARVPVGDETTPIPGIVGVGIGNLGIS
jgi:hypothetical protein